MIRVHAIECSGSMYCYIQKTFAALKNIARPEDFLIFFNTNVSKVQRWAEASKAGHQAIKMNAGGQTNLTPVFDWMDARFLLPTDELIIYSDFYVGDMPVEDTYYTTRFVDLVDNNTIIYPNRNVYRIGEHNEGYQLIKKV